MKMQNGKTEPNVEMPQLQQMVLENTLRINRNEMQINEMRMENKKQKEKVLSLEEWREKNQRDYEQHIRRMREMDESFRQQLAEYAANNELERKKHREEMKAEFKERDRKLKAEFEERDRKLKAEFEERDRKLQAELEQRRKEDDERQKKYEEERKQRDENFDKEMKEAKERDEKLFQRCNATLDELGRKITDMVVQITGVTGHIIEGLISSTAEKMFQDAGFDLYNKGKEIDRKLTAKNLRMEVDVLLSNDKTAVPIEVKTDCTKKNIDHFIMQMGKFRTLFPEYSNHEVIAGIAAINYERDAYQYALEKGLLTIHVNSDYLFSIDPASLKSLHKF